MQPTFSVFTFNGAQVPTPATANSACFDLAANLVPGTPVKLWDEYNAPQTRTVDDCGEIMIDMMERMLVPTGLIFDIPDGWSLRLHPRSGTALKKGLNLANCEGVVDSDYVHETFLLIINNSLTRVTIEHGERLAQGEFVPVCSFPLVRLESAPLQKTDRIGGLGSTGTKQLLQEGNK